MAKAYCSNGKYSLSLETVDVALQEMQQCGNGDVISGLSLFYDVVAECLKLAVNEYDQLHAYSHLVSIKKYIMLCFLNLLIFYYIQYLN